MVLLREVGGVEVENALEVEKTKLNWLFTARLIFYMQR